MKWHHKAAFLLLVLPLFYTTDSPKVSAHLSEVATQETDSSIRLASEEESSYLVTVHGTGNCSGAPIKGTNLVITAAHCVVEAGTDTVGTRFDIYVERSGVRYDVSEVYVDTMLWKNRFIPKDDVAVLVMKSPVIGPGLHLADSFETDQPATLVGMQPAAFGTWLRGTDLSSHMQLVAACRQISTKRCAKALSTNIRSTKSSKTPTRIPSACYIPAASAIWSEKGHWRVPCGAVPGASGGPLIAAGVNGPTLVGVVSSVDSSLKYNGVAPVEKIQYLLAHPDKYRKVPSDKCVACTND